ncbi:MAG: sulfatase [Verrucomicrobiales bacterium]|nr:sulfatase [Verrucomicrobiales bacterium]
MSNEFDYKLYDPRDHQPRLEDYFQTRREWLGRMTNGFGAVALTGLMQDQFKHEARAQSAGNPLAPKTPPIAGQAKVKRVIHIYMEGAMPHLDNWDPKPELMQKGKRGANPGTKAGNRTLLAPQFEFNKHGKSGLELSEVWPNLGRHADDTAVVRSVYTDAPAHGPARILMNTGDLDRVRPSVGSWVLYGLGTENQNLPGFIALKPGGMPDAANFRAAFLPGALQGTYVDSQNTRIEDIIKNIRSDFTSGRDQRKQLDLLFKLNEIHKQKRQADAELEARIRTFELAYRMQTDAKDAFDIAGESDETLDRYGRTRQGRQFLIARRLMERGVRFVQLWQGGWDLHNNIPNRNRQLAGEIDPAIGALMDDLKERGLFEDTLIYLTSEFGRSSTEDGGNGRSHNAKAMSAWFAGGAIKGGTAFGETDALGGSAATNKVHVKDLHATILHTMGFDHEKLTFRAGGREMRLTEPTRKKPDGGQVVKGILA